jgi:DNA-directed RNA polymerase subunit RPC12/RpoP
MDIRSAVAYNGHSMSTQFPPSDYVPTESAVAGITVFKPRPPAEEAHALVIDFRCPRCDATTGYSTADGGLTCQHCGHYEPPSERVVGRDATQFEFRVETLERAAHGWGVARNELVCNSCGAHTTVPLETLTHTCPFCDSNQVVQAKAPQDILRPRHLLPFSVDEEAALQAQRHWLGSSWMTPGNLQQKAQGGDFVPIYVPFWNFDARTTANWKAQVGHQRTRTYYSNGKRRTRTETEWRWESGQVNLPTRDLLIEGTDKVSPVLLRRLADYRLDKLVPYDPSYLAGLSAQAYDITLDKGWELGREVIRQRTRGACEAQASTDLIRNFSMNMDFHDEVWRYVLVPVYINAYQFNGETFQVLVNGQTATVSGQRPVEWTKVWLAIVACMLPGVFLGLLSLVTLIFGFGALVAPFALAAFFYGFRYARKLYVQAEEMTDV